MPAAVIAVLTLIMLAVATSSDASPSCMTKTEANRHFRSVHIYWHGHDHCWDGTPTRRRQKRPNHDKWRDAMSEILGDREKPVKTTLQQPWVDRWVNIEPTELSFIASRWVDIAQVKPPLIIDSKPRSMLPPHLLLLVMIALAIALTLATVEFLFRRPIFE